MVPYNTLNFNEVRGDSLSGFPVFCQKKGEGLGIQAEPFSPGESFSNSSLKISIAEEQSKSDAFLSSQAKSDRAALEIFVPKTSSNGLLNKDFRLIPVKNILSSQQKMPAPEIIQSYMEKLKESSCNSKLSVYELRSLVRFFAEKGSIPEECRQLILFESYCSMDEEYKTFNKLVALSEIFYILNPDDRAVFQNLCSILISNIQGERIDDIGSLAFLFLRLGIEDKEVFGLIVKRIQAIAENEVKDLKLNCEQPPEILEFCDPIFLQMSPHRILDSLYLYRNFFLESVSENMPGTYLDITGLQSVPLIELEGGHVDSRMMKIPFCRSLADRALFDIKKFTPSQLSSLVRNFQLLGVTHTTLFKAIHSRALHKVQEFEGKDAILMIDAWQKIGFDCREFLASFLENVLPKQSYNQLLQLVQLSVDISFGNKDLLKAMEKIIVEKDSEYLTKQLISLEKCFNSLHFECKDLKELIADRSECQDV